MKQMQLTLEKINPSNMRTIADEVKRCRTLLKEHMTICLHDRSDEEYHPSDDKK